MSTAQNKAADLGTAAAAQCFVALLTISAPSTASPTTSGFSGTPPVRPLAASTIPPSALTARLREVRSSTSLLASDFANTFSQQDISRPTTEHEKVVGELREWILLDNNWDGENAQKPIQSSLEEATSFIRLLKLEIPIPEPMLLSSGRAALLWQSDTIYADLEFLGNERIAYYIEKNKVEKHKGVINFDSKNLPALLTLLLADTQAS